MDKKDYVRNEWGIDSAHIKGDVSAEVAGGSVIGDPDPYYDDCGVPGQVGMIGHVAVRIPVVGRAGVDELDEAHAALGQAAGD